MAGRLSGLTSLRQPRKRRLQEQDEEDGGPGDEDGEAALGRDSGDDALVSLAPEGDSGVGLVGLMELVGDAVGW